MEDEVGTVRPACTECQRRKQKCNREWPCNHCLKRKVADRCRFNQTTPATDKPSADIKRKRQAGDSNSPEDPANQAGGEEIDLTYDEAAGFKALGYMPSHHLYKLSINELPETLPKTDAGTPPSILPQLQRALEVLPPRPYTDTLVETFKDNVNFHYYILYPPSFLDQYRTWWLDRQKKQPLDLSWTCLLLIVCACAAQYLDVENQEQLESDLGETAQALTQRYHTAALELGSAIPPSQRDFHYVQYLLHLCYWYKSEARFVECWHSLNDAIREAQELGIHKLGNNSSMPEFDREMRNRVWCILDTWDWQISGLLSRPMIIDRADCDVELPSLNLEKDWPSPILHMKLQSKLISQLSQKYGKAMNLMVATPAGVQEYRQHLEQWRATFPARYDGDNPDTSLDKAHPWLILHRHYLQTISLLMILDPFKSYLSKTPSPDASQAWLEVRRTGVDYCLKLTGALRGFFDYLYPRDAKFHFVLFCIFDVATILCSALLHDTHENLPRRDEVWKAVKSSTDMLQQLNTVTKSAKTSYEVVCQLVARIEARKSAAVAIKVSPSSGAAPEVNAYAYKKSKVESESESPPILSRDAAPPRRDVLAGGAARTVGVSTPQSATSSSTYGSSCPSGETAVGDGGQAAAASDTQKNPSDKERVEPESEQQRNTVPAFEAEATTTAPNSQAEHVHPSNDTVPHVPGGEGIPPSELEEGNQAPVPISEPLGLDAPGMFIPHMTTTSFEENTLGTVEDAQQQQQQQQEQYTLFQDLGFGDITTEDFGDFGEMWNWQQLDLGFGSDPPQE